jgi:hypothetical protein
VAREFGPYKNEGVMRIKPVSLSPLKLSVLT